MFIKHMGAVKSVFNITGNTQYMVMIIGKWISRANATDKHAV